MLFAEAHVNAVHLFHFLHCVNFVLFRQLKSSVRCSGDRMVRMYAKLHKSMETLEYFTTRSWEWTHGHLDQLKSQMTPEDQKVRISSFIIE